MASSENLFKRVLRRMNPARAAAAVDDGRSRRFVAVIDCILNQNARDAGAARFPALNFELLQLCHEYQVGILQMPCPEIAALGFRRARNAGTSIRAALDTESGRQCCTRLAAEVADRIATYCDEGYEFVGVLGGNPQSPGCAVHHDENGLTSESGVFMQALQAEFGRRALFAKFVAIRDHDAEQLDDDLKTLRELFCQRDA